MYIKLDKENIIFFEDDDESYKMVDLYLNNRFLGYKDSYNYYILMLMKYCYLKKVIINILLDITI